MMARSDLEHQHQVALFDWAKLMTATRPELKMLAAVPNGGLRSKAVAGKLKAEGVKSGYPDTVLDVARAGYHGLKIEMKAGKNTTSDTQDWWITMLLQQGYAVYVAYTWAIARDLIIAYLDGHPFDGVFHKTTPKRTAQ